MEVTIQPGMWTRGDKTLIRAVMENLVRNAWKFTSKTPDDAIQIGTADQEDVGTVCFYQI